MYKCRQVAGVTFADYKTTMRIADDEVPARYLVIATRQASEDWAIAPHGTLTMLKALSGLQIVVIFKGLRTKDRLMTISPKLSTVDEEQGEHYEVECILLDRGEAMYVLSLLPVNCIH